MSGPGGQVQGQEAARASPWPGWLVPAGLAVLAGMAGYAATQVNQTPLLAASVADLRGSIGTLQASTVVLTERINQSLNALTLRIERAEEASKSVAANMARAEQGVKENAGAAAMLERALAGVETRLERQAVQLDAASAARRLQSEAAERELRGSLVGLEQRMGEAQKRGAEVDERILQGLRALNQQLQELERRVYEAAPLPRRGLFDLPESRRESPRSLPALPGEPPAPSDALGPIPWPQPFGPVDAAALLQAWAAGGRFSSLP